MPGNQISVVSDDEIQFPLVTVCNYKKLHCGRLIEVLNECVGAPVSQILNVLLTFAKF